MVRRTAGIPAALTQLPLQTVRPADAEAVYAHPRTQIKRLTERGLLHRLAHGYYVVVPPSAIGQNWRPTIEAAAAGIATADFGVGVPVLMAPTAGRIHGAIPRALATAVVAVPEQRRPVRLTDRTATVRFVTRDTGRLDAVSVPTELGRALVTTPEQTVLDLAHRPTLADVEEQEAWAAVRALLARSDDQRLDRLASERRRRSTLRRARYRTADP